MADPIELPPLNPNEILAKVQQYDQNLFARVVAEMQRDQLAEMVQTLTQTDSPAVPPPPPVAVEDNDEEAA